MFFSPRDTLYLLTFTIRLPFLLLTHWPAFRVTARTPLRGYCIRYTLHAHGRWFLWAFTSFRLAVQNETANAYCTLQRVYIWKVVAVIRCCRALGQWLFAVGFKSSLSPLLFVLDAERSQVVTFFPLFLLLLFLFAHRKQPKIWTQHPNRRLVCVTVRFARYAWK